MLLRWVIGAGVGAALGGLVGVLVRSSDKAWAFISTPGRGAFFGAVVGLVFVIYFGAPIGWRPEAQSHVVPLTAETFDETVAAGKPVVVVFYSEACPPCHRLAPRIERLADEYEGRAIVARVDAGAETTLADRYNIRAVPTLIYFAAGKTVGAAKGILSYGRLRNRVEKLINEHAAGSSLPAKPEPIEEAPPAEAEADNRSE